MTEAVARHSAQIAGLAGGSRKSFCKWGWGKVCVCVGEEGADAGGLDCSV